MSYTQELVQNFIRTSTGKKFRLDNPKAEDFSVEDIAHALSNLCRFTGHTPRFYSVGEHSIHCLDVAMALGASPLQCLYALLHDASEAVMNDLARPVKQNLPQYKALEDEISSVMWEVCGLPEPTEEDYKFVKKVDNTLIIIEMQEVMFAYDYDGIHTLEHFVHELVDMKFKFGLRHGFKSGESTGVFLEEYERLIELYKSEVQNG